MEDIFERHQQVEHSRIIRHQTVKRSFPSWCVYDPNSICHVCTHRKKRSGSSEPPDTVLAPSRLRYVNREEIKEEEEEDEEKTQHNAPSDALQPEMVVSPVCRRRDESDAVAGRRSAVVATCVTAARMPLFASALSSSVVIAPSPSACFSRIGAGTGGGVSGSVLSGNNICSQFLNKSPQDHRHRRQQQQRE